MIIFPPKGSLGYVRIANRMGITETKWISSERNDIWKYYFVASLIVGKPFISLFFFFMNGNTERAQCALSRVCIPKKTKRKAVKIKKIYKISKRVIKKNYAIWSLRW